MGVTPVRVCSINQSSVFSPILCGPTAERSGAFLEIASPVQCELAGNLLERRQNDSIQFLNAAIVYAAAPENLSETQIWCSDG